MRPVLITLLAILGGWSMGHAQEIINGSFEINHAPYGIDQMDLTNSAFNDLVPHCHSFGYPGQDNPDLITTSNWGGPAQHGKWFVGLQGGGADQISLSLTGTLFTGATYNLTFYDRVREGYCSTPVQIGISNAPDEFGMLVHTSPEAPAINEWTPRLAVFTVPFFAEYITIRAQNEFCWIQVDDFCLSAVASCIDFPAFMMPNVFTPNGDGVNDTFLPIAYSGIILARLTITNRWGNILHSTTDPTIGWDGKCGNQICSDGIYFWAAEYTTIFGKTNMETGSIMLFGDR